MEVTNTFWTCTNCNEQVEEQFDACWNCQHNREGFRRIPSQSPKRSKHQPTKPLTASPALPDKHDLRRQEGFSRRHELGHVRRLRHDGSGFDELIRRIRAQLGV